MRQRSDGDRQMGADVNSIQGNRCARTIDYRRMAPNGRKKQHTSIPSITLSTDERVLDSQFVNDLVAILYASRCQF